jgi:hypothetical protein
LHSICTYYELIHTAKEREREMAPNVAKPIIKVAALSGSLRKGSYHRGLIRAGMLIVMLCHLCHFCLLFMAEIHFWSLYLEASLFVD